MTHESVRPAPRIFDLCSTFALAIAAIALAVSNPDAARAQNALEAQIGSWAVDGSSDAALYSAALWRNAWGPFGYSFRALGLIDRGPNDNSLYGLAPEITLLRGDRQRAGFDLYAAGGVGLALRSSDSDVTALWSGGLGLELRAPALFSANVEARRLVEDTDFSGFWNLSDGARQGWLLTAGISFRWGGGPGPGGAGAPATSPSAGGSTPAARPVDASSLPGDVRGDVVRTALEAMGEPYRWGGTSTEEGFDCSGLVWYAYTSNGVSVPRVSRDQALAGRAVPRSVGALEPGDVLLFSNRPGVITHVGLYVGETRFIHATTSGGVRVGSLAAPSDGNDRWYLSRWTGARRIVG